MSSPSKDIYLVIGGSGFLGRHIVQQLLDRGDTVSVLDIVQRYHDVPFYSADICDEEQVADALRKSGTTCIIHTASPPANLKDAALYYRVNVDGAKAIIAAAVSTGVRKLVYTSSAGVVFTGENIIDVDERVPIPKVPFDAYNDSKAKGEAAVLAANGHGGLLTVALRPAGIFGPGDRQVMTGFYNVYQNGKTHMQVGDNTNLFDWTYVGNVARAHLLAADKLVPPPPLPEKPESASLLPTLTRAEEDLIHFSLPPINLTTGQQRTPTSAARPLGPYVTLPPDAEKVLAAFESPVPLSNQPIVRSRFDPLSEASLIRSKISNTNSSITSPLQVAGQSFFISNGEPVYFWDFGRAVWHRLDSIFPEMAEKRKRKIFVLSRDIGLLAGTAAEWYGWLVGKPPPVTRFQITFSCTTRWHNIEKARRLLGYEPEVGLEEGINRMVDWWREEFLAGNHQVAH